MLQLQDCRTAYLFHEKLAKHAGHALLVGKASFKCGKTL